MMSTALGRRLLVSVFATLACSACGSDKPPATAPPRLPASVESPQAAPLPAAVSTTSAPPDVSVQSDGGAAPSLAALPASLTCLAKASAAPITQARLVRRRPPVPGQMTEAAAKAKALYDAEKWAEALDALKAVAEGDTGDDDGNRQLAGYHAAVALFRLNRYRESYATFHGIAKNRNHLKHSETLLWISKFAQGQPEQLNLADFAYYTREDVERFNNASQMETYATLVYLLGRERLQAGSAAEARELFDRVPATHAYASYAKDCSEVARSRLHHR